MVLEAQLGHAGWLEEVAPVHHQGAGQFFSQPGQIQVAELLPFGDHHQRVDATGQWITVPLRAVHATAGWAFEIGPYSLRGEDACDLAAALVHYGRMSADFERHEVVDL